MIAPQTIKKIASNFLFKVNLITALVILFYPALSLNAHEVAKSPWFAVNNEFLLVENPTEKPESLPWGEHTLNIRLSTDEQYTFEVLKDNLEKEYNKDITLINWAIESYNKEFTLATEAEFTESELAYTKKINFENLESLTVSFNDPSTYILYIQIFSNKTELIDEQIQFNVGEFDFDEPDILINDVVVAEGQTTLVKRKTPTKFAVSETLPTEYNLWNWEDGGLEQAESVEKIFNNTKMPSYVFLRRIDSQTGFFKDFYRRLNSTDTPDYIVYMPPQIKNEKPKQTFSIDSKIIVFAGFSLMLFAMFYLKKGKSGKITKRKD